VLGKALIPGTGASPHLAAPAIMCSALASSIVLSIVLPAAAFTRLMDEGGPVENATAALYIVAIGAVWAARNVGFRTIDALASTLVLLACLSREISLRGRLANRLAPDGEGPLPFDVSSWALVLVVCAAAWLVARHGAARVRGLARAEPLSITLLTLACCVLVSQLMDRSPRLTGAWGYALSGQ
jgi:hypothetical protein